MGNIRIVVVFLLGSFIFTTAHSLSLQSKQRIKRWSKRIAGTALIVAVPSAFVWRSSICRVLINILPPPAESTPESVSIKQGTISTAESKAEGSAKKPRKSNPNAQKLAGITNASLSQGRPSLRNAAEEKKKMDELIGLASQLGEDSLAALL